MAIEAWSSHCALPKPVGKGVNGVLNGPCHEAGPHKQSGRIATHFTSVPLADGIAYRGRALDDAAELCAFVTEEFGFVRVVWLFLHWDPG
jgi:hypothetical protein